jgi:cytoplasmic iron level regulating protein YaaA (DUF328/UPF0246 family)
MHYIISPSKTQQFDIPIHGSCSQPLFPEQTGQLVHRLQQFNQEQLAVLMKMSDKLAAINHGRYQRFQFPFTPENSRQALFMFQGDQFAPMAVDSYSQEQLDYGQQHLRILSGLYGMLRPLDLIQPYRLEMAVKLAVGENKNLYSFWGELVTARLNKEFANDPEPLLVNLASAEYFKVIRKKELQAAILTLFFKEEKAGKLKTVAIYAKRARGAMLKYIIQNQISRPEELQGFTEDGYCFARDLSKEFEWVFIR